MLINFVINTETLRPISCERKNWFKNAKEAIYSKQNDFTAKICVNLVGVRIYLEQSF